MPYVGNHSTVNKHCLELLFHHTGINHPVFVLDCKAAWQVRQKQLESDTAAIQNRILLAPFFYW